ncbi:MAG: glycine cleavage system protein GcvH [Vampirovibrio sp.]|nr:glycine cleavage system protein GcvH [Vampirovibrio sp.]
MATVDTAVIPSDVKLIETHEYILPDEDRARIGISHFAAEQLGDIVYVDLPELGQELDKGETFGSIESVKAASDLYLPVGGKIMAVNTRLEDEPDLVNDDPYGDGWIIEISVAKPEEMQTLMAPADYTKFVEESDS